MDANFKLGITFLAIDQFSSKFSGISAKLGKFEQYTNKINDGFRNLLTPLNVATIGFGSKILKDFSETEDATIQLKNTMMGMGGVVSSEFEGISKKAEDLGALLPGTTADFYKMASSMRSLGVGDSSLSSALEATAKMAVVLKPIGVTFEQASEATAKFKNALGIADADMVSFADTIQRSAHLGANLGEMQYAFSRMAGVLKVMNMQGLEQSNKLTPLIAMLIKVGKTGETVGTSLTKIFSMGVSKKQFGDIEGMFKWLAKNSNENINKIFGGGDDAQTALLLKNMGMKEYLKTIEALKNQGSLDERVNNSLNTLTNTAEAMGGAINKLNVSFGKLFAENVKSVANYIGNFADKTSMLIDKFPTLSKVIGGAVLGLMSFSMLNGIGKLFTIAFGPGITMIMNVVKAFKILNAVQAVNRSLWVVEVIKEYGIAGRAAVGVTNMMTKAQALYNAVANANPYLLMVTGIGMLIGITATYIAYTNRAISVQEHLADARRIALENTMEERAELKMLFDQLADTNPKSAERAKIIKELTEKYPELIKGMDLEKMSAEEIAKAYDKVAEAIEKKAIMEAMQDKIKAAYKAKFDAEMKDQEYQDNMSGKNGEWGKVKADWSDFWDHPLRMFTNDSYKNDAKKSEDQIKRLNIATAKYLNPQGNTTNQQQVKVEQHNNITINGNVDEKTKNDFKSVVDKNAEFIAKQIEEKNRQNNRGNYGNGN